MPRYFDCILLHGQLSFLFSGIHLGTEDGSILKAEIKQLSRHFSKPLIAQFPRVSPAATTTMLPAGETKHLPILSAALPKGRIVTLRQLNDNQSTTGTTLWPGGQVLAAYLADSKPSNARVLELGAGIGYLALSLQDSGYNVTATDVEPVLSLVLRPNVGQTVEVAELDWFDLSGSSLVDEEWDIIVTADTVYAQHLLPGLWDAIQAAVKGKTATTVYVAMERRDPGLVDAAIAMGSERGCVLRKVSSGLIEKAIAKAGWDWAVEDWEDVEIWKGKWK